MIIDIFVTDEDSSEAKRQENNNKKALENEIGGYFAFEHAWPATDTEPAKP